MRFYWLIEIVTNRNACFKRQTAMASLESFCSCQNNFKGTSTSVG